jgi:hypothetical protein
VKVVGSRGSVHACHDEEADGESYTVAGGEPDGVINIEGKAMA